MLVDWFTVGAQTLNFLILIWLMKRFLYKPILDAIDAREKRIADALADADRQKLEAQKERDDFQQKNERFDSERAVMLKAAADQANAEHQKLLQEARDEADALLAKREASMQIDARNLNQAIAHRAQQEVFSIARKALADLADKRLEDQILEMFLLRMNEMGAAEKQKLIEAFRTATVPAIVRSGFDLSADQRAAILNSLNAFSSAKLSVIYETSQNVLTGIEITANGQKLVWSVGDYISSMEKVVSEFLENRSEAGKS